MRRTADVAQLAEHLICNQAVASSILAVSSEGNGCSGVLRVSVGWGTQVANGIRL